MFLILRFSLAMLRMIITVSVDESCIWSPRENHYKMERNERGLISLLDI